MQILPLKKLDKDKTKVISFSHFKSSYTCQPYFIWAEKDANGEVKFIPNTDANGFSLNPAYTPTQQNDSVSHNFDFLEQITSDEEDEEATMYDKHYQKTLGEFLSSDWNYASENKNSFALAYKLAVDFLIKELNIDLEQVSFNTRIFPTNLLHNAPDLFNEFIENNAKTLLIDPTFTYLANTQQQIDFVVKASAFAYDKTSSTIYLQKAKSSTSLDDYLKAYFIYNTALKMGVKVKNIAFILFHYDADIYKQGSIPFLISQGCFSSNTAGSVKREGISAIKNDQEVYYKNLISSGLASQNAYCENLVSTIFNSVKYSKVWSNPNVSQVAKWQQENKIIDLKEAKHKFNDFDQTIDNIIQAYSVSLPIYSELNEQNKWQLSMPLDTSSWGKNPELKRITSLILGEQYLYSTGYGGTGNALKILDQKFINTHKQEVKKLYAFPNYFTDKSLELLSELMRQDEIIVWYDYEGVSSILTIFDGLKSYRQIAHQVSIIVTQNGEHIYQEDILKDPKNITLIDLVDVILAVYHNKADKYVVFNKSYENTRNLEIRDLVAKRFEQKDVQFIEQLKLRNIHNLLDFESIVLHIRDHTIDLLDFFTQKCELDNQVFYVSNYVKHSLMHKPSFELDFANFSGTKDEYKQLCDSYRLQTFASKDLKSIRIMELLGYTSIKKLEKLISKSGYKYRNEIKEYAGLEIKNGSMALELAANRCTGLTGDLEWNAKVEKLKEYCHNDVIAMIVVYEFILGFIGNVFTNIHDLEYKIPNSKTFVVDFETKKLTLK
ncbi:UU173 family protein [Mycoplasma simbae]|uniref:UU173 family protein n=1 Tax=Mycoplasma simbae TaxID=36744 RepID=UPI0004951BD9|nr:DUF2779 domain-containing protein [Mycoplasma simbae]